MPKVFVIMAGVLLALLPWMSGGSAPLAILISVFGLIVAAFLASRLDETPQRAASWPLRTLTALWLGWGALSLIWSVNRYDSELWLLYAIIGVVVFALVAGRTIAEKRHLLTAYSWIAAIAALYGGYLYFTGDYGRLTTSFYWANPCAAYLLPAALIAGWGWLASRRWSALGGLGLAQTLVLATAVWLTDSRGALLAAAIVLLVALANRGVRRRALPVAAIIILSFGLSLGLASLRTHIVHQTTVTPGSRFAAAAQGESTSESDRLNYLKSALQIWEHHPLIGTGAGTFGVIHPQYQRRVISAGSDAHNIIAQDLAEQGLIGLILFIYLLVVLAVGIVRGTRRQPALGVAAAGAGIVLIHFGLDIDDRYPALIALAGLLAGASYQMLVPRPITHLRRRLAVPALLLLAVIFSISAYQSSVWAARGQAYDQNSDFTTAASDYGKAQRGPVYNPTTWNQQGIDYYTLASLTAGSKTYDREALASANASIARDPDDAQNYFLRARVERLSGATKAALADYHRTLQLDPWNHPDYYLDLATLELQLSQTTTGQQTISQALALYPDSVIANRNADTTLKPAVAELLALQAAGLLEGHHASAAHADLARALRLDPRNHDAAQLAAHGLGQ